MIIALGLQFYDSWRSRPPKRDDAAQRNGLMPPEIPGNDAATGGIFDASRNDLTVSLLPPAAPPAPACFLAGRRKQCGGAVARRPR
jgi:hypothetical protein